MINKKEAVCGKPMKQKGRQEERGREEERQGSDEEEGIDEGERREGYVVEKESARRKTEMRRGRKTI